MDHEKEADQTTSGSGQTPREGPRHVGVVCDSCNSEIYGVRYKCLVCADYDLCSSCEKNGEHVDHNMVTIRDPRNYNPWGFPRGRFRGPWRGRGRHCGGRGHYGGPWMPPFFLQNLFGGQQSGAEGSSCRSDPPREKPAEGKLEEMDTEQQTSTGSAKPGSEEEAQLEREQHQTYLQDIGEAVSNFLRPFGVKVDVDVVDESKKTESAADTSGAAPSAPEKVPGGCEGDTVSYLQCNVAQV